MDFRKDLNSASQYTQQIFILSRQIEKIYAKFQTQQWTMKGGVQGKRGGGGLGHWEVNFGWWEDRKSLLDLKGLLTKHWEKALLEV